MKIINLIENTEGAAGCAAAHGLAFYAETGKHRLLVDLGPSGETLKNAEKLGVDLTSADTVILSHGHYDHAGGILPFAEINSTAKIYMQRSAAGGYYSADGKTYRYIGIDRDILSLPQVIPVDGDWEIDQELCLFTVKNRRRCPPSANSRLMEKTGAGYVQDSFAHEQYLVITENGRRVLLSGCAHNGILNIMEEYVRRYGMAPAAVISGFHLMKKTGYTDADIREIRETAEELKHYETTFYTGHCTGEEPFAVMKEIMGDRLVYVHSGDALCL